MLKNLPAQCAASNCFCQDFFLFLDVSVGKWDLYSFSIVLTIPSSMRTGSGVAGGVRISSARDKLSLPAHSRTYVVHERESISAENGCEQTTAKNGRLLRQIRPFLWIFHLD